MKLLYANDAAGVHAHSWYRATAEPVNYPQLNSNLPTDICVIGAGYTGLSTALHLAMAGQSVVLLDAHRCGWGASGRNGGQLGSGFNQSQDVLESSLGMQRAHDLWLLAEDAKKTVHALCKRYSIDVHYQPGIVSALHRKRSLPAAHAYAEKLQRDYGYNKMCPLHKRELRALLDSDNYHGGVLDRGAGHLHPLKFAIGLGQAAQAAGVQIHELSEVIRVDNAFSDNAPLRIVTPQGSVRAERVVLACNGYLDALEPHIARRIMPINNFIVATEPLGERGSELLPKNHAVYDSRYVVNYFRLSTDGRLLFGGGENYRYRFPVDIECIVRSAMLGVFPQLHDVRIDYSWGGTLAITRSRLPCVRSLSPRIISAGGYSGHGVALAIETGRVIAEALGGDPARFNWLEELPAARFPGGSLGRPALLALAMKGYSWLDRI